MHVGNVDAGHQLLQVLDAIDPLAFQGLAVEHADRRRHALRALFAAPGGDGDGLELTVAGLDLRLYRFCGLGRQPVGATSQQQGQGQALEPP
ncbi:hypothetical protein D9M71_408380 [compost metagenome]